MTRSQLLPVAVTAVTLTALLAVHRLELIPVTLAGILAIVLLAFTNAWAALDESRFGITGQNGGGKGYVRRFVRVEAFWRAFITNLSFGGVSLSLAIIVLSSDWGFWDINNAVLPLLANFVMGLFAPRELRDEYDVPPPYAWRVVAIGLALYLWAGCAAWSLYKPPATKNDSTRTTWHSSPVFQPDTSSAAT